MYSLLGIGKERNERIRNRVGIRRKSEIEELFNP